MVLWYNRYVGSASKMKDKVLVKWHDAKFSSGTQPEEEIIMRKMATFESMGYLILRDETTTIIAAEYNDEGQYRDITLIPSGSVISITGLTTCPLV